MFPSSLSLLCVKDCSEPRRLLLGGCEGVILFGKSSNCPLLWENDNHQLCDTIRPEACLSTEGERTSPACGEPDRVG